MMLAGAYSARGVQASAPTSLCCRGRNALSQGIGWTLFSVLDWLSCYKSVSSVHLLKSTQTLQRGQGVLRQSQLTAGGRPGMDSSVGEKRYLSHARTNPRINTNSIPLCCFKIRMTLGKEQGDLLFVPLLSL